MERSTSLVMTADELGRLDLPGKSAELVRGRLVVREPPGTYHGALAGKLTYLLGAFVYPNGLGIVTGQGTGFKIATNPDTVRAPNVAYLSRDRATLVRPRGYAQTAPELVIEILSPDDAPSELLAKISDWLGAGVRLVWIIDPVRVEGHVYRTDGSLTVVASDGALDGEAVLPGFRCRLSDVFAQ